ncbi:methionine ABC transporter ATP-binding protein [Secundilactobacillus paracollinoides]|uniref:Methionine ABC transporter ATP-binding protein n=1 Tax=Secundilactobacillus paracollinoides TaxID=240427 RepID=A0A1B2IZY7_9LACO|nr:methionine ABC transporter ATP-binding protein [Secundilactobacillus paracollinoides]ANZ61689.1 methionine ABC transporter ATP-binding protein [Secundilactobacillus paracollinoides]ANZ63326.1 methionine ABC transporter ATP-binding protein [Secundilactobacillus paracollinoides]ANZ67607.1 methionine ABC transporter ATP-binding protein [Secundilactobacillus paracollinoides]KRL75996.1 amino acid ABC transporter ATP-binding protein [Secundilactobacillus paracollinoides DSM 15502 = JCM 11969]
MIEFKDVSKTFTTKDGTLNAVQHVNFNIEDGEIYGVVGYSGAGKSTLVRMLNGLETPTSGAIDINGDKISELSGTALRKKRQKIGMIFQHFNLLWSRTVIQNVMFPLEVAGVGKKERREKAQRLVDLVGLNGREKSYPSELSGGQKQRVGVARALANDPEILISDEATSALDPQTTDEVLDLLLKINRELNLTIVLITHEMHAIRKICDHVAVMEEGKVVERGTVFDVFRNPQQEITKRFVNEEVDPSLADTNVVIDDLIKNYPKGVLLQLVFHGDQAKLPIVSEMIHKYPDLQVSIIEGSIHQTQEGAIGSLFLQLIGEQESIDGAQALLKKMRVETEVIHHD